MHTEVECHLGGNHVRHAARQGDRGHGRGPALAEEVVFLGVGFEAVASDAEDDGDAFSWPGVRFESGVSDGLAGRGQGEVGDAVQAAGEAAAELGEGVKAVDAAGDVHGQADQLRVGARKAASAAHRSPGFLCGEAAWDDHSKAGDCDVTCVRHPPSRWAGKQVGKRSVSGLHWAASSAPDGGRRDRGFSACWAGAG